MTGWFTKKDVMRDLAKVSGIHASFNENCVVIGEQPPPHLMENIDNEQLLRLCGGDERTPYKIEEPDLDGITNMLRMIDQYDESLSRRSSPTTVKKSEEDKMCIVISKLNPHVAEFVPKTGASLTKKDSIHSISKVETNGNNVKNKIKSPEDDIVTNRKDQGAKSNKTGNCETDQMGSVRNGKVNVAELKREHIKELRETLKLKISDSSKTNCVKAKRERNIAIATLLKLYSDPPKTSSREEPPKLITPDYFQCSLKDKQNEVNINCNDNSSPKKDVQICSDRILIDNINTLDSKAIDFVKKDEDNKEEIINNEVFYDSKNSDGETGHEEHSKAICNEKDIEVSVEKVSNWFNNMENGCDVKISNVNKKISKINDKKVLKKPIVCFGPVTFKKKGVKSDSPSLSVSDNVCSKSSVSLGPTTAFVPTSYAKELSENYTARAEAKVMTTEDIWTRLEKELKAKDLIIKGKVSSNTHDN